MKKIFSGKESEPVPSRVGTIVLIILMSLMSSSVAAAETAVKEGWDPPVVTAGGNVVKAPWYITVDGRKIALVESKNAADKAVKNVVKRYSDKEGSILDVEIKEKTSAEKMHLKNGDEMPKVLTVKEAEKKLLSGNNGDSYITVMTTQEEVDRETIDFTEGYKPDEDLYVGESEVESEGQPGSREIVKKVVKQNGAVIKEEVVEEEIKKEPKERIIRTGTKKRSEYGRVSAMYEDNRLSYDEDAVYVKLHTPVTGGRISSDFGERNGEFHRGLDIALQQGSDIRAAESGDVYYAGWCGSYGNIVKIDHGNGMQTYYAHCSKLLVNSGQKVERGERIALVGSTGNSTGPHVHFEVIINRTCVDPTEFIDL